VSRPDYPCVATQSGRYINLLEPKPGDIDAGDIAWHLANEQRSGGAFRPMWSVGQHSVVGSIMGEVLVPGVKTLPANFLMHDSPEAYLKDIPTPLKLLLTECDDCFHYGDIYARHVDVIERVWAVELNGPYVKIIDDRMLATEWKLFGPEGTTSNATLPPFNLDEFIAARSDQDPDSVAKLWDDLWEPWEPAVTEMMFLNRMEKLGL
jgi:hypothetical protein